MAEVSSKMKRFESIPGHEPDYKLDAYLRRSL